MTEAEKLAFIQFLQESAEKYFSDYHAEISLLLTDPGWKVRFRAVDLLWNEPDPEHMQRLIVIVENDPVLEVRLRAIVGLGRYIYEGLRFSLSRSFAATSPEGEEGITEGESRQVREYLLGIHRDNNRGIEERCYALEALSFSVEEEIQDLILRAYKSPHKLMRLSALFAMGRNGLSCWKNIILVEMESRDRKIQLEAINAAGSLGPVGLPESGEKLLNLTYQLAPETARAAIRALARTGWQGAFDRLDELTHICNQEIRELAVTALKEWTTFNARGDTN